MTLTISKDMRAELHGVRHQGRRPTCLAFAASDVHRHARRHPEYLCVEWLYYHAAKQAGTGPHVGITIPDTRSVLRALGQPEEPIWPYNSRLPNPATWIPPKGSGKLMISGSNSCGAGTQAICQHIDDDVPVVVGMFISDTFNFPHTWDQAGPEVILGQDATQPTDQSRGHAVVVVGRGDYCGDRVLLLRNSWGSNWGYDGHAWVRESYLTPRLSSAFVISKGDGDVLQSDGRFADAHPGARLG